MKRVFIYLPVGIVTCLIGVFGTFYFLMPSIPESTEVTAPKVVTYISELPIENRLLPSLSPLMDGFPFDQIDQTDVPTSDNHYKHTQNWRSSDGINVYCTSDSYKTISEAREQFRQISNRNFRLIEKDQSNIDKRGQMYFEVYIGEFTNDKENFDKKFFRLTRFDEKVEICTSSSLPHLLSFELNYIH